MSRVDALIDGWSAHKPAPVKFRELLELGRELEQSNAELLTVIGNLCDGYRTFRNVPEDEQEWTSFDEDALQAGFATLAKNGR